MKIISINVNNWGGKIPKPLPEDYKSSDGKINWGEWNIAVDTWRSNNKDEIEKNVKGIVSLIYDFDIAFLHEVDTNCISWNNLHAMLDKDYDWKPANRIDEKEYSYGRKSISCVFIKRNINYSYDGKDNFSISQRNVEIEVDGVNIIGLHANYTLKYWKSLESRISKYLEDKKDFLIIGDFNVSDKSSDLRDIFNRVLSKGANDIWIKQGESASIPTCDTGKRIDYALTPESLLNRGTKQLILNSIRKAGYTDHAAIAVIY